MYAKWGLYAFTCHHRRTAINPNGVLARCSLGSPVVRIEDHKTDVLSCDFNRCGNLLLSSSRGGEIHMCTTDGVPNKIMKMKGHKGPVMEVHFSKDETDVISCSVDKTLGIWDASMGTRVSTLEGHTNNVNSVQRSQSVRPILCSGSKDKTVRIWDTREGKPTVTLFTDYEVNATCFNANSQQLYSGGNDKDINVWDLRKMGVYLRLQGHTAPVTGLSLSPCGQNLLSHGVDNMLRIWQVNPKKLSGKIKASFASNQYYVEGLLRCTWSPDSKLVSAGTADHNVFIWDASTGGKIRAFPGHEGCVNDVAFHPIEPIILSASNDSNLYLNEI